MTTKTIDMTFRAKDATVLDDLIKEIISIDNSLIVTVVSAVTKNNERYEGRRVIMEKKRENEKIFALDFSKNIDVTINAS